MNGRGHIALGVLLLVGCVAAAPAAKTIHTPTQRTADCTSGGCHAAQTNFKALHNPVSKGSCESCHVYVDAKSHEFTLRSMGGELCTFCHIGGGGAVGKVAHKPFAEGECLSCHRPHGGDNRLMLRKPDVASLCATCHADITRKRKHLHGPVATGSCAACHSAHRSAAPKLLAAEGREFCLSCHEKMSGQIHDAKVVHKPAQEDCRKCHEVHASDHVMQLKEEPSKLCLSCHDKIQKQIATATVVHSAATSGEACLNCHTPHGGQLAKLMKADPATACLKCHDKGVETKDGRQVASMAALADPNLNKHGPIREGDCGGCHVAHGSDESHLLAKPYSSEFYQPFAIEKYELCFSCHDRQLVLLKNTSGLTGFRNGEVNLHFLHVNKEEKGRNCRACHSTHVSSLPVHLQETVKFGNWQMPLGFRKTEHGGTCKSGCHQEYAYDRENPVVNKVEQP